jgi:hypothetical protein
MDESEADDGAIHRIGQQLTPPRVLAILLTLLYLSRVRGTPTPTQRARAQALADDPVWSLGFHPIVARILDAP